MVRFIVAIFLLLGPATGHSDIRKSAANIGNTLNSMVQGTATFPKRFGINRQPEVKEPDITLTFKRNYLNKVIAAYLKNPIALDAYSEKPRSFITVKRVVTHLDPKRNVLIVKGEGGVLTLGTAHSGIKGRLVLKKAEFEISPVFRKNKNGQFLLELLPRCVYLDIDRTAQFIDLSIAHTLQELYLNRKPIRPVNVSDLLNSDVRSGKKPLIRNRIVQVAAVVTSQAIELRTAWLVE